MDQVNLEVFSAATRRHRVAIAVDDLVEGLKRWELWSTLGWNDIRQRYRRSFIGPFWITLSMGMMVAGLAYLYAGLFGQNIQTYLPYVATGIIIFGLIQTMFNDGANVFISASSHILQLKAPLSVYIYQMVWRNLLTFFHNITIYVVVVLFTEVHLGWNLVLAALGMLLVMLSGVSIAMMLGTLSARFRDVPPIVASLLQVAFFMTPVFWLPNAIPGRQSFIDLNPFYYLLEIVRMPLLGQTPPLSAWLVTIGLNVVGFVVGLLFFARYRERVAYWV